ncbi:uncharacterized protein LOC132047699 [Lycium ferocissimum]|uniref:uncharacterized protein LOC132047699 n=1 Tax=Lycium ferocissimum TaxID=112874 RepID=UPI002815ED07|nr:uncharacterized protein LOC132047699 [Lycium ferocissimum]
MGDFNNVLNGNERVGSPVTAAETKDFKRCVDICRLQDLKSSGSFYTWNNKHGESTRVYSRIDRALVNGEWITSLPASEVHFANEGLFDHCPGMINWETGMPNKATSFKYFNMWSLAPGFQDTVKQSWEQPITGTRMYQVVGKLNRVKAVLRKINRESFHEVEKSTEQAREKLLHCQTSLQQRLRIDAR